MKVYLALLIAILMIGVSSCSSTENTNANTNQNSANSNPEIGDQTSEAVNTADAEPLSKDAKASREQIEAKDAAESGLGPTDVMRAFNDAVIKKDAAKIKSFLSRASLKMIEESAKKANMTVDQILTSNDGAPMPVERIMQNEKIDGDVATLEVQNSVTKGFEKQFLVKENGNWRVALDMIRDEMIREFNKGQNAPTPKGK